MVGSGRFGNAKGRWITRNDPKKILAVKYFKVPRYLQEANKKLFVLFDNIPSFLTLDFINNSNKEDRHATYTFTHFQFFKKMTF